MDTNLNMVFNWPIGKLGFVAQMAQIVNVAEKFVIELRIMDFRDGTELHP